MRPSVTRVTRDGLDRDRVAAALSAAMSAVAALIGTGQENAELPAPNNPTGSSHLEPPIMPTNPDWEFMTAVERAAVESLLDGPLSGEQIATKTGESYSTRLKSALASLVERKILHVTRDGYQVNLSPDQIEQFRERGL
jgi:hypothetical protein